MTDSNAHADRDPDRTSSSLLLRARQDDADAWDRIVEGYGEMVYRWCRSSGLSADTARDIGQEVFLAAYRSLKNFQPRREIGSFRAWLRTITKSKFVDYLNREQKNLRAAGGSEAKDRLGQIEFLDDDDESVNSDLKLLYQKVEEYIRTQFSSVHCDAFCRVFVEEEDPSDVASQLGLTRNAVYLACGRIRKRVRDEFGDG